MKGLRIRIEPRSDEPEMYPGLPVTIRSVRSGTQRRLPPTTIAVPVSHGLTAFVDLDPAVYDLELVLPGGELVTEQVRIADGEVVTVLRAERERFRTGSFKGGWYNPLRYPALLPRDVLWPTNSTSGFDQPEASLGRRVLNPATGEEFDPRHWAAWEAWLEGRAAAASEGPVPRVDLRLRGAPDDLALDRGRDRQGVDTLLVRRAGSTHPEDVEHVGARRPFIALKTSAGVRMTSLPWPWPAVIGEEDEVFMEIGWSEEGPRVAWAPSVQDPTLGGLLAYLGAGQVGRAGLLLRAAEEALFFKRRNPLGAAAGGYVRLATATGRERDEWPDWLDNLTRWFPHLPDAPILRARWLLAQRGAERLETVRELLLDAFDRGLPFFSAGVVWLIDGLRRLSVDCQTCRDRFAQVRGVARSMDLTQTYTTFDLRMPAPDPFGDLEPELWGREAVELPGLGRNALRYDEILRPLSLSLPLPLVPRIVETE